MALNEIFTFLGLVLKLALILFEDLQKTPSESRLKEMAAFDAALNKAKDKNDLRGLSKWFGKHL